MRIQMKWLFLLIKSIMRRRFPAIATSEWVFAVQTVIVTAIESAQFSLKRIKRQKFQKKQNHLAN